MMQKEIISPGQRRRLPEGFGWVDHRLVRENVIENFSAESLALYLFLITVGGRGRRVLVCRRIGMPAAEFYC